MVLSEPDIPSALLASTRDGTYPESDQILTTDLGASALEQSLQLIREAQSDIEVCHTSFLPRGRNVVANIASRRQISETSVRRTHRTLTDGSPRPDSFKMTSSSPRSLHERLSKITKMERNYLAGKERPKQNPRSWRAKSLSTKH